MLILLKCAQYSNSYFSIIFLKQVLVDTVLLPPLLIKLNFEGDHAKLFLNSGNINVHRIPPLFSIKLTQFSIRDFDGI